VSWILAVQLTSKKHLDASKRVGHLKLKLSSPTSTVQITSKSEYKKKKLLTQYQNTIIIIILA